VSGSPPPSASFRSSDEAARPRYRPDGPRHRDLAAVRAGARGGDRRSFRGDGGVRRLLDRFLHPPIPQAASGRGCVGHRVRPGLHAAPSLERLALLYPIVVALGVILAPYYVPFLASGFPPEKLALAITLARIVFPFIALIGFGAMFMGILNSHHRFFSASSG